MINYKVREGQKGAVSLFVVIFAALLLTVVTVGFVQIMTKDHQQAGIQDLSQSANDSALAGIEDAKRLLLLDQACRDGTAAASVNCLAIAAALTPLPGQNETACNALSQAGIVGEVNNETLVQQSAGDNATKLDQAYTCVKIGINTGNYEGRLEANKTALVPIMGVSSFDTVEVSWFSREDVSSITTDPTVNFPYAGPEIHLPRIGGVWGIENPPLLRTQLIQMGGSFKLSEFNDSQAGPRSNANTLFLYPTENGPTSQSFAFDARRSPTNVPQLVDCEDSFNNATYVCKATITLPAPIDGNVASRNAYLRLTALYNGTRFSVKLKNGASDVLFNRVQPEVDSTGRANDVFRRVKARVELKGEFSYPEAAIDMVGDLCKNFVITNDESGYANSSTCTP